MEHKPVNIDSETARTAIRLLIASGEYWHVPIVNEPSYIFAAQLQAMYPQDQLIFLAPSFRLQEPIQAVAFFHKQYMPVSRLAGIITTSGLLHEDLIDDAIALLESPDNGGFVMVPEDHTFGGIMYTAIACEMFHAWLEGVEVGSV